MRITLLLAIALGLALGACGGDDDGTVTADMMAGDAAVDLAVEMGESPDAGQDLGDDDAAIDGGPEGCTEVTVTSWEIVQADDVSIWYGARVSPRIDGLDVQLLLQLVRFGGASYEGSFALGEGELANYATCPQCLWARAQVDIGETRSWFADAGTLVLNEDPFSRTLDAEIREARLGQVTIGGPTLESTPVPGGSCFTIASAAVRETFVPSSWLCDPAQYADGQFCDCDCSNVREMPFGAAPDPDCFCDPFMDPEGCADFTLTIRGCAAAQTCDFQTDRCLDLCDREEGPSCPAGTACGFGEGGQDLCHVSDDIEDAGLGGLCTGGGRWCAVDEGNVARGMCDVDDGFCKPTCEGDGDCTSVPGDVCSIVFPDGDGGAGFCRQPFPPDG
ncbi:MAG: hypothetical protein AAF447_03870 [Myxococcota bacterium]